MVRTSRGGAPAANVDALDNIDLDDMFADEGDALFDGLDIDLDMDDIAGSGGNLNGSQGSSHNRSTTAATTAPLQPSTAPQAPVAPEATTTRTRRKTKRKTKSPAFFEDDDDSFEEAPPPKKKKRASTKTNSSTAAQRKRGKKQAEAQPKKGKAAKMPPPTGRGTAATVAAAGQFGGRQAKRGASFTTAVKASTLVRTASETSSTSASSKLKRSQSLTAASSSAAASLAEIQASHPGLASQSNYCGLPPSNTLFYPFMPALPSEPSLKSRKVYPYIDRVHVSFTSHLASGTPSDGIKPAKESEPIFQLVQEAHKEEKPPAEAAGSANNIDKSHSNRVEAVGNAIGTLRKTISNMEKPRLAGDWYAVCALLQRQHDFLVQNLENMERWCKDNFSAADYADVFHPPTKVTNGSAAAQQLSVLGSFATRVIKVKVICTGAKETNKPLIAVLPQVFSSARVETSKASAKTKTKTTKKRKATAIETKPVAMEPKLKQPAAPISYINMKPARRRKAVADMLSRTARELEVTYLARSDVRQKALDREEGDLQKMVQDDKIPAIHTTGMWRWIEKSGFFSNISEAGIRQFMNDVRSPAMARKTMTDNRSNSDQRTFVESGGQVSSDPNETLLDRLQSLLVEEEDSENDADEEDDYRGDVDFREMFTETEVADVSKLTLDERSFIHLQRLGLAESITPPVPKRPAVLQQNAKLGLVDANGVTHEKRPEASITSTIMPKGSFLSQQNVKSSSMDSVALSGSHKNPEGTALAQNGVANSTVSFDVREEDDLESVIDSMKRDLIQVDEINGRRASFLKAVVRSCHQTAEDVKRKNEEEATFISKCQQLLRKSKEMKAKAEAVKKENSLALPW